MIIPSKQPQAIPQTLNKPYLYNSLTKPYNLQSTDFEHITLSKNNKLGNITNTNFKTKANTPQATHSKRLERTQTYKLLDTVARLLPKERVATCLRCRVSSKHDVTVNHNGLKGADGKAYYSNLMRCSSVWTCPICSKRILNQRAKEIDKGLTEWIDNQLNHVFMLTLTVPHKQGDKLQDQLDKQRQANKRLFNDRVMRKVWALVGKVGQIKALEYTNGRNGHHNHSHAIIFTTLSSDELKRIRLPIGRTHKNNLTLLSAKKIQRLIDKGLEHTINYMDIEQFIKFYWVKLCRDVGLGIASLEHGATITDATNAKKYLTKFKTALELTSSNRKTGKKGNRNQWELLADYQNGDTKAGALFQQYAKAYKGERQLFWSRGLKALLGIDDIQDDEVTEDTEDAQTLITIPFDTWILIQQCRAKADVLTAIEDDYINGDTQNYTELIKRLKDYNTRRIATRERNRLARMNEYIPDKFMAY